MEVSKSFLARSNMLCSFFSALAFFTPSLCAGDYPMKKNEDSVIESGICRILKNQGRMGIAILMLASLII